MTAVVPESWGAYEVTHVVAAALAVARSRAAVRGESVPRVSDVAFAVISAPDSLANAALAAVRIAPGDLLAEWPAPGDPGPDAGDERMAVLFARANRERRRTNDEAIASVHLLAALAALPDAELAHLDGATIDLDLLRTGAARTTADIPQGDRAFAPPVRPPVLVAPETPDIAELRTRTRRSRSAVIKQVLEGQLPSGSTAISPYGVALARRWARLTMAYHALAVVTLLLALRSEMSWWIYLALLPALATPTNLPATVWLASVAAAVALCPAPVAVAVALTAAAAAAASRYALWMKRIDLAEPGTTLRDIRSATKLTWERLIWRKLGIDDDD